MVFFIFFLQRLYLNFQQTNFILRVNYFDKIYLILNLVTSFTERY